MKPRLYILPVLAKSFTVDFFVLLPVLYAQKVISSAEIGYIGALSIAMLVIGALVVSKWLHKHSSRDILVFGALLAVVATILLGVGLLTHLLWLIIFAYALSGLLVGFSISATNALVARHTDRGNRFSFLARSSMLGDLNRISFPLVVALALSLGGLRGAIGVMLIVAALFVWFAATLPSERAADVKSEDIVQPAKLMHNRLFQYFLGMEFLDSFASSQLYVFLPILFLAKGYSLQSSLILQTAIFIGYLSGRWIIGRLAGRYTGPIAVGVAESGMVVTIVLLLLTHTLVLLYVWTFLLGVFARGTSPVIKALAFDSLHDDHMKQGSALHVVAGDSGSALGQLSFGLLLAWIGIKAPFVAAAVIAGLIAIFCVTRMRKVSFVRPAA